MLDKHLSADARSERRSLIAILRDYTTRYRYPAPTFGDVDITNDLAWGRCRDAAQRILDEVRDDGISMGAEEDAEAGIGMVREMADPIARAMDVHEWPTTELLRFGALLVRAMDEIRDEGIGRDVAVSLARVLACPSCGGRE